MTEELTWEVILVHRFFISDDSSDVLFFISPVMRSVKSRHVDYSVIDNFFIF